MSAGSACEHGIFVAGAGRGVLPAAGPRPRHV